MVVAEDDTQNVAPVILVSERCEGSPSALDIKKTIVNLEVQLPANDGGLVVLGLFERPGVIEMFYDTGRVQHAPTKEELVKIITNYTQGDKPRVEKTIH